MDRAVTALHTADRALNALESLLALPPTTDILPRFSASSTHSRRCGKRRGSREGVAASSPKGVVRASHSAGFLGDTEAEPRW